MEMKDQQSFCEINAIKWEKNQLVLLDQRYLPLKETYYRCESSADVIIAIKEMVVRGAPAIGITAAYGVLLSVINNRAGSYKLFEKNVLSDLEAIAQSRPTAVNLMWAIEVMKSLFLSESENSNLENILYLKAKGIHQADIENNMYMGMLACEMFRKSEAADKKFSVITHCNAGALATGGYGTALGAIRSAWHAGLIDKVYVDETRPWLQGARLTSWELKKDKIPVCLNVDNASGWLMSTKNIKWVIVGADRIAENGDVANKIGTFNLSIIAKYHDVKVMVVAPSNTIDVNTKSGADIEIEMRSESEIRSLQSVEIAPLDVAAINPVFDVTPANLVDVIVTELGVVTKPDVYKIRALFEGECRVSA